MRREPSHHWHAHAVTQEMKRRCLALWQRVMVRHTPGSEMPRDGENPPSIERKNLTARSAAWGRQRKIPPGRKQYRSPRFKRRALRTRPCHARSIALGCDEGTLSANFASRRSRSFHPTRSESSTANFARAVRALTSKGLSAPAAPEFAPGCAKRRSGTSTPSWIVPQTRRVYFLIRKVIDKRIEVL